VQVRNILPKESVGTVIPHPHPSGRVYYGIHNPLGKLIANAYHTSAEGYDGGLLTMMTIISGDEILGLGAMDLSTQTEGYGQNGAEVKFLKQFSGKKLADIPLSSSEWTAVDMISGATRTSDAIAQTIHEAFDLEDMLNNKNNK
jgi:uncharacterized protein with FMN-binding domain